VAADDGSRTYEIVATRAEAVRRARELGLPAPTLEDDDWSSRWAARCPPSDQERDRQVQARPGGAHFPAVRAEQRDRSSARNYPLQKQSGTCRPNRCGASDGISLCPPRHRSGRHPENALWSIGALAWPAGTGCPAGQRADGARRPSAGSGRWTGPLGRRGRRRRRAGRRRWRGCRAPRRSSRRPARPSCAAMAAGSSGHR